jgi:hypothetical protein
MILRVTALLLLTLLVLLVTGCGSTSTSATGLKGLACKAVASVNSSLTSLASINSNTTVGQVKSIQQNISTQLTTVAKRVPGGGGFAMSQLTSATNQLNTALQGQPDSATLSHTSVNLQGLKSKVASAQSAVSHVSSTLKCS